LTVETVSTNLLLLLHLTLYHLLHSCTTALREFDSISNRLDLQGCRIDVTWSVSLALVGTARHLLLLYPSLQLSLFLSLLCPRVLYRYLYPSLTHSLTHSLTYAPSHHSFVRPADYLLCYFILEICQSPPTLSLHSPTRPLAHHRLVASTILSNPSRSPSPSMPSHSTVLLDLSPLSLSLSLSRCAIVAATIQTHALPCDCAMNIEREMHFAIPTSSSRRNPTIPQQQRENIPCELALALIALVARALQHQHHHHQRRRCRHHLARHEPLATHSLALIWISPTRLEVRVVVVAVAEGPP